MALYLLDADALIDFTNRYRPTIALLDQLAVNGDRFAVCDISVAEAYSGLGTGASSRLAELLAECEFVAAQLAHARQAGAWRYEFARRGVTLATTDVLIAATALAHNATIVTGNIRHFPMQELSILPLPR
jgi:predicted nucleic acid-binding protein